MAAKRAAADWRGLLHEAERELADANEERLELRRRIARAERILRTPGMWSDFASRALAALGGTDGDGG